MPYFPQSDALVLPAPALSYRNILGRNGGFEVWQRGAGGAAVFNMAASSIQYTADGWSLICGTNQTMFVGQQAGLTSQSRYCIAILRNPGQTGVGAISFEFPLDTDEIVPMRNNIVTLSATMSCGANWSPASGLCQLYLYTGTGAPVRITQVAYTGLVSVLSLNTPVTSTPTRVSVTSAIVVPANATQATVIFQWSPVGTAGADDSIRIDDVQLEIGSVATPFERRPFEQELLACKRHYWKTFNYDIAPVQNAGVLTGEASGVLGVTGAVVGFGPFVRHPIAMRVPPTVTLYNPQALNGQIRNEQLGADHTSTALNVSREAIVATSTGSAGGTVGHLTGVHLTADAGI